jgi:hypothetical protein
MRKKRPVRLTAKQAPHRPDTAPAQGLRAEVAVLMLPQTERFKKEGRTWGQKVAERSRPFAYRVVKHSSVAAPDL